jgi:hypothetical protein
VKSEAKNKMRKSVKKPQKMRGNRELARLALSRFKSICYIGLANNTDSGQSKNRRENGPKGGTLKNEI